MSFVSRCLRSAWIGTLGVVLVTKVAPAQDSSAKSTNIWLPQQMELNVEKGILGGTLLAPKDTSAHVDLALLIAGSGPTDRDGNSPLLAGKNNSLKMLAEALAKEGIASLRYDKRGVGVSKAAAPPEIDMRFDAYIRDAEAWLAHLRSSKRFRKIIVVGHSEGAWIGLAAATKSRVDGFVSLAGPGRPLQVVLREQLTNAPMPDTLRTQAFRILSMLERGETTDSVPVSLSSLFRPSVQPYLISTFKFDPIATIKKATFPILIIQGTTDLQVSVQDAEDLAHAVPQAKLVIITGMNHILKMVGPDRQQQLQSYSDPTLPIASDLPATIKRFIEK